LSFLGEIDGRFIGRVGLRLLHGLLWVVCLDLYLHWL
jgi:hypothetical protein